MAIDPERLAQQRNVIAMPPHEVKCDRCGRRTRDKKGTCSKCQHTSVPHLPRLTTEQLVGLIDACRAELKRRRDELDAALGAE